MRDYFKEFTGKTFKEAYPRQTTQQIVDEIWQIANSKYPLRTLGQGSGGSDSSSNITIPLLLSEEARASHIHILGTTREGKSKFLELLIRHDIDHGYGCTLLDPSDNGQTCYDILRYCYQKKHKKVCLIDLHDNELCIPTINPLKWRGGPATDSVVQNIMQSIRLLWGQTSFADTPRIETYLSAVLTALYAAKCTLPDAQCFLVKENVDNHYRRLKILDALPKYDKSRQILEEVFNAKGQQLFLSEFKPSIRRLAPLFDYLPGLVYGSTKDPIDFSKLIADKWVILVNLDMTRLSGEASQRVLGTLVINEIINAISSLRAHNWQGQHYLYIDEAGQFATRGLANIMAYKGKSGLWATVSHQFYSQFEDKVVLDAIENLCKIKVLFYTPNATDRNRMVRDMYTGELREKAGDVHAHLKKQHAVIKIGKEPPATIRIADVPSVEVPTKKLNEYKEQIYKSSPWYATAKSVREEIKQRFAIQPTTAGKTAKKSQFARGSDEPQRTVGEPSEQPKQGTDKAKPKRKSVFDDISDS